MFLRTQNHTNILNISTDNIEFIDLTYENRVLDDINILITLKDFERGIEIGCYKGDDRAMEVMDELIKALSAGECYYTMPKE